MRRSAEGSRAADFNLLTPGSPAFAPETLTTYEIGLKSLLLDHRVRLNLASFYNDYSNIQVSKYGVAASSSLTVHRQNLRRGCRFRVLAHRALYDQRRPRGAAMPLSHVRGRDYLDGAAHREDMRRFKGRSMGIICRWHRISVDRAGHLFLPTKLGDSGWPRAMPTIQRLFSNPITGCHKARMAWWAPRSSGLIPVSISVFGRGERNLTNQQ